MKIIEELFNDENIIKEIVKQYKIDTGYTNFLGSVESELKSIIPSIVKVLKLNNTNIGEWYEN